MLVKYPIMGLSYAHGCFAICGGGGSLKSGIKNTVDIYRLSETDPTGFTKDMSVETGIELASGVAFSHDGLYIAVSVNAACWIYEINTKDKTMTLLVKFRTDFAEDESSQSTACFVGDTTVLTGGEDGVVRVWSFKRDVSQAERAAGTSPSLDCSDAGSGESAQPVPAPRIGDVSVGEGAIVTLMREHREHTKRIRGIHVDPSHRNLVVSSSEDMSCHMWRLTETAPIWRFSKDDALDIAYQTLTAKPLPGPRKHQFRCVQFANNGRTLYTVLTPARGDSILIKWVPETIAQESPEQWRWVVAASAIAGDKPVASLCVSQDDRFVCTAAVSGDMKVFLASTLQPYKKISQEQHSFAITGMSFAPSQDKTSPIYHLVSGGADKNLLRHDIPLQGGEMTGGLDVVISAIKRMISGTVGLGLSVFMAVVVLFILLLFIHAEAALLLDGPLEGLKDLSALRVDSPNALATVAALVVSVITPVVISKRSSTTTLFLSNGLLCLLSGAVTFYAAVSPDLRFTWQTGDAAFDELLDYKISIILGGLALAFLVAHSLLATLL